MICLMSYLMVFLVDQREFGLDFSLKEIINLQPKNRKKSNQKEQTNQSSFARTNFKNRNKKKQIVNPFKDVSWNLVKLVKANNEHGCINLLSFSRSYFSTISLHVMVFFYISEQRWDSSSIFCRVDCLAREGFGKLSIRSHSSPLQPPSKKVSQIQAHS